ncbi:MAG: hypothetical protein PHE09_19180 [Oscillospiraceae bacterium]|nr:hypothetical protein [Oscillospiraceae bacterium]
MNAESTKKQTATLCCGLLGCLCFGVGDWLMLYGDPSYTGGLFWLTEGVARLAHWRLTLAMALAFPGIVFYGTMYVEVKLKTVEAIACFSCKKDEA